MITGGIDAGIEYTKAIVLKDGKVIGQGKTHSGGAGIGKSAEKAWAVALEDAGVTAVDVSRIIVIGKGKYDVSFASDRYTEAVGAARAARYFCPEATTIVNIGADEMLVVTLGNGQIIKEMVINQKCSAGLGLCLNSMARRLEYTSEDMSGLDISKPHDAKVNDGCVVFAELDALSLLNRGYTPEEVAIAVTEAAAVRASSVLNDITAPVGEHVVLAGGLAKNGAFVKAFKARTGIDFIIPVNAEYAGAVGAALLAAEQVQ